MSLQNWLQLLIPLLIVFGPIVGKVFQKISESKKERERVQRMQRAQLEALRTGRAADTNAPFRNPDAQQLGMGDTPAPVTGTPQQALSRSQPPVIRQPNRPATRILRLPGGLTIEVPVEPDAPSRPAQQQARGQQKQSQPAKTPKQPKRKPQRSAEPQRQAPLAQAGSYGITQREVFNSDADSAAIVAAAAAAPRGVPQPPRTTARSGGRSTGLGVLLPRNATPADVRKAMVLSEIFGPPVGGR